MESDSVRVGTFGAGLAASGIRRLLGGARTLSVAGQNRGGKARPSAPLSRGTVQDLSPAATFPKPAARDCRILASQVEHGGKERNAALPALQGHQAGAGGVDARNP